MKRVICILSIIFLALVTANAKIHTIGDSTMADYDQNEPEIVAKNIVQEVLG